MKLEKNDCSNISAMCQQLDSNGFVLIENVLSKDIIEGYKLKLNSIYKQLEESGTNIYPGSIGSTERLILNLHNKDESFIELIDEPSIFPLIQYMLQQGSYQNMESFNVTQFSARDPHQNIPAQQLHIDSRFPGPPFALMGIALWMLNDFTPQSGGTRLVPQSHFRTYYPDNGIKYADEVVIEAPAGSVLIYNGSLWHGGGMKQLDVERWSIIVSYGRWFLKPAFDMTKNMPPNLYKKLSPTRRELFGFTSISPVNEHVRVRQRIPIHDLPESI